MKTVRIKTGRGIGFWYNTANGKTEWVLCDDGPLTLTHLKGMEEGELFNIEIETEYGIHYGQARAGMSLREEGELRLEPYRHNIDFLPKVLKSIESMAENPTAGLIVQFKHEPTGLESDGMSVWAEGNREIIIKIKEHNPPSYYREMHIKKQ